MYHAITQGREDIDDISHWKLFSYVHCYLNAKLKRRIDCFKSKTKLKDSTKYTITLYIQNEHYRIEKVAYSEQKSLALYIECGLVALMCASLNLL
jgi:hypothetical protein